MTAAPAHAEAPAAEHGIIYQPAMILALRRERMPKTHTRRLQRLQALNDSMYRDRIDKVELRDDGRWHFWQRGHGSSASPVYSVRSPYGGRGDHVWARETLRRYGAWWVYAADGEPVMAHSRDARLHDSLAQHHKDLLAMTAWADRKVGDFCPSIHMPRWASREIRKLVDVRPERLQTISAGDAIAEGLSRITKDSGRTWKYGIPDRDGVPGTDDLGWPWTWWDVDPIAAYRRLWDGMHAKAGYGWATNPWIWRLVFRKVAP